MRKTESENVKEGFLTLSLLLPFMAVSGEAYANHNYQHHPNQVRAASPGGMVGRESYAAYVMEGRSAFAPRAPGAIGEQQPYRCRGPRCVPSG